MTEAPSPAWRVANAGQEKGPFTTVELIEAVRTRRVPMTASAWHEGMPGWVRVADLPVIHAALGRRGFDAMTRRQLVLLGALSVVSGGLLFVANTARALAGHDVGAIWAGLSGAMMAPGILMLWKAWRR